MLLIKNFFSRNSKTSSGKEYIFKANYLHIKKLIQHFFMVHTKNTERTVLIHHGSVGNAIAYS